MDRIFETLDRLFGPVFDLPQPVRAVVVFCVAALLSGALFFLLVGLLSVFYEASLDMILGGAVGTGIGTGVVCAMSVSLK